MKPPKPIRFIDLAFKYQAFAKKFHADLDRVLSSGAYILGSEGEKLENSIRDLTGAQHAIAVANGTDALVLSLKACGIKSGDEVITTPMSYLATTSSIALCGAEAVFVDVDTGLNLDPNCIEDAITDRTRAISVTHLAGIPAKMERILEIANRYGLSVIEDCAQSFGAVRGSRFTGTFGRFGTFSFHPLKNFGTLGDGGMVLAHRQEDADWIRQARNHGHHGRDECDFWTINSRLDEVHAAFLSSMLEDYPSELARRRRLAEIYRTELNGVVEFPAFHETSLPSYNWIMILVDRREELIGYLANCGIEVKIHYPRLIPDLKAAERNCRVHGDISNARRYVRKILSVPTAEHISESDARFVCDKIKQFYSRHFLHT